jgi:hypothetical protein
VKHLHYYEHTQQQFEDNQLQLNDYVICSEHYQSVSDNEHKLKEFIDNNIGQFIKYDDTNKEHVGYPYYIEYKYNI